LAWQFGSLQRRLAATRTVRDIDAQYLQTMPIAAGVIGTAFEAAGGAAVAMSAQNGGAAGFDGPQHLQVRPGQVVRAPEGVAVGAHDVR
jgi:hypothetical protein